VFLGRHLEETLICVLGRHLEETLICVLGRHLEETLICVFRKTFGRNFNLVERVAF
jgi:hypothetical protein